MIIIIQYLNRKVDQLIDGKSVVIILIKFIIIFKYIFSTPINELNVGRKRNSGQSTRSTG